MAKNINLGAAKMAKNDEFYTQYEDIEREMNAYLEYEENYTEDIDFDEDPQGWLDANC